MKTKLLAVVGSLNRDSLTRHALRHVLDQAAGLGAEIRMWDLLENPLPLFNPDTRRNPEYAKAVEQVNWANAFLLGTPDYHGSMSGAMKNFLDYFWKEFAGKLFGYVCASHEKGLTAMDQMRTAVRQCYGWSLPYGGSVTDGDFDEASGKVIKPPVVRRLDLLAHDLVTYGALLRTQFEADLHGADPAAGFAVHYRPRSAA